MNPHAADTLLMLVVVSAVMAGLWWMVPLDDPAERPQPPRDETVVEVLTLHPADVKNRGYLTARALDRGLRASARRAGLLTLPAAALLPAERSAGALVKTRSDMQRLQAMAWRTYQTMLDPDARPYRLSGRLLVRQDKGRT